MSATDIDAAAADRVQRLDDLGRWWLHVDLDVLATSSLAAVDDPQPGGLDWSTLTALSPGLIESERRRLDRHDLQPRPRFRPDRRGRDRRLSRADSDGDPCLTKHQPDGIPIAALTSA